MLSALITVNPVYTKCLIVQVPVAFKSSTIWFRLLDVLVLPPFLTYYASEDQFMILRSKSSHGVGVPIFSQFIELEESKTEVSIALLRSN